ncbi:CRISPR system precrRNA processing endoribonuclease RAMP protein Cas6 [Candidatus Aerophobetes bacterium]|nr:CRISPR system precrRNA processing endoribonuclease RAMP protein Cas6 [Candidatus Aerophobetes bacterium]
MENFRVAKFEFKIVAQDKLYLPEYKGSTFRGGFGNTLRKVVCITKNKECCTCLLKEKCIYSYIFETPPPKNTKILTKYPYAPHPFVIEPPLETKKEYQPGDEITFNLVLIGRVIDYLPYFIFTFDKLGKIGVGKNKVKYRLKEVESNSYFSGDKHLIFRGEDKTLYNSYHIVTKKDIIKQCEKYYSKRGIALKFITPTRIKYQEHLIKGLEFHILIRNLLRRIAVLSYFHCDEEVKLDFAGLIERARRVKVKKSNLKWYDWDRYSTRQNTRMKMGGFIGDVSFKGDLKEFLPFVFLGQIIHVGKGTSFGLGSYKIVQ